MQQAAHDIAIRDARPQDRDAILAFREHAWSWGDVVPQVLDHWLGDPAGTLRVAETDAGAVVGAQYYYRVDESQCWLSGAHVDPAYRVQGVAGLLLDDAIRLAREEGKHTLRYASEAVNDAVHQLSRAHNSMPRGTWLTFERVLDADACAVGRSRVPPGPEPSVLKPDDVLRAYSLLHSSGHSLYVRDWAWRDLDEDVIAGVLGQGRGYLSRSGVGGWSLALMEEWDEGDLEITLYGMDPACTQSLLDFLRRKACQATEGAHIVLHVPQTDPAAGFLVSLARRGEWRPATEHALRIWELALA